MNISDLCKRAESGNVAAQTALGICYLDGVDVRRDLSEAFRLLTAAASQGAPRAVSNLARMYAEGLGTDKNLAKAIHLHEAAAEAGEFFSQVALGRIFSRGLGVTADPCAALRWYSDAAAQEGNVADCEELREAKSYAKRARDGRSRD